MNILLVSGTHPRTPHISGVRAARFAEELARLGHRCVLLCPTVPGEPETAAPIADHDWSSPYVAAVAEPEPATARGAAGRLATATRLLRYGGNRAGLFHAMLARARDLRSTFSLDAVWTTFGSLEASFAARRIARDAATPWLLDVKDNPDLYVPRLMRVPLAMRLRGYAALLANSVLHAEAAQAWLGDPAEVVYSGVDRCFFDAQPAPPARQRYVTLVGSLYSRERIDAILRAIADFNARGGPPLAVVHIGTQGEALANPYGVQVETPGYVSPVEMARLCQHAMCNIYVFLGYTFHHKLFELLACRRPVIAYGGELPESLAAAESLHAPLLTPDSPVALQTALARIDSPGYAIDPRLPPRFFTWPEQAAIVDAALRRLTA